MVEIKKTKNKKIFFIGIDLGGKEKRTSGICILEYDPPLLSYPGIYLKRHPALKKELLPFRNYCRFCRDIYGKDVFKKIEKYLKETKVIAIDAPLTKGKGKGKMRLYEKFLSTQIFRKEKINPLPPALFPELSVLGQELVKKLKKKGFVLDLNLIEVFPTMVKKICDQDLFSKTVAGVSLTCQTENQKSALICAILAFLHFNFKTRYLGYRDGFLFLPETSFWKDSWIKKFYQAWKDCSRLKYRHLVNNIFIDNKKVENK